MNRKPRVLFVCSKNQWRSPTAEKLYQNDPRIEVRSAGLSPKSPHQITSADITWAELILVMEEEHKKRIIETFRGDVELPEILVLGIPDEYRFMDPELVEVLRESVEGVISSLTNG
jgi:predicted protein tyrosine phosphatase